MAEADVKQYALTWLALRLQRASIVESELLDLISRPVMNDDERKRYEFLTADNKTVNIKDVLGVLENLNEEDDSVVGFEEFD